MRLDPQWITTIAVDGRAAWSAESSNKRFE
jgi:hypothetical protein